MKPRIARLVARFQAQNAINIKTVEIFFQKLPGWPKDKKDERGISAVQFQVCVDGTVIQQGNTSKEGKIDVRVRNNESELQLVYQNKVVAKYKIKIHQNAWEADNTIKGIQRRLKTLGYYLGHAGTENDGVDGVIGEKTDKAILDFQIDNGLDIDGKVGNNTKTKLKNAVGGTA